MQTSDKSYDIYLANIFNDTCQFNGDITRKPYLTSSETVNLKAEKNIHEINELQYRWLSKQIVLNKNFATQVERLSKKQIRKISICGVCEKSRLKIESLYKKMYQNFAEEIDNEIDDQLKLLNQDLNHENHKTINRLKETENLLHTLNVDVTGYKSQIYEKDKVIQNFKRNLDEAMLQISKAVLERTKYMNERDNLEKKNILIKTKYDQLLIESSDLHTKLAKLGHDNAQLHNKLVLGESGFIQKTAQQTSLTSSKSNIESNEIIYSNNIIYETNPSEYVIGTYHFDSLDPRYESEPNYEFTLDAQKEIGNLFGLNAKI